MGRINSLVLALFLGGFSLSLFAQDYEGPRTEWGQPDLQGVWNWSSNGPMQRPSQYGERQFLTQEEVEEFARRRAAAERQATYMWEGVCAAEGLPKPSWLSNSFILLV